MDAKGSIPDTGKATELKSCLTSSSRTSTNVPSRSNEVSNGSACNEVLIGSAAIVTERQLSCAHGAEHAKHSGPLNKLGGNDDVFDM